MNRSQFSSENSDRAPRYNENQTKSSEIFKNLSNAERIVLNVLAEFSNQFKQIFPSHYTIALHAELSISTIKTALNGLKAKGLITVITRGVKKTCLYLLQRVFYEAWFRQKWSWLLPALKQLCIHTLATIYNEDNIYNYKACLTSSYLSAIARLANVLSLSTKKVGSFANALFTQNQKTKEKIMNDFQFPDWLEKLTIRNQSVSLAGKCKLIPFPLEAIHHANKRLQHAKELFNPFGYFLQSAIGYCKDHRITPAWELSYRFLEHYGIEISALTPMLETRKNQQENLKGGSSESISPTDSLTAFKQAAFEPPAPYNAHNPDDFTLTNEQFEKKCKEVEDACKTQEFQHRRQLIGPEYFDAYITRMLTNWALRIVDENATGMPSLGRPPENIPTEEQLLLLRAENNTKMANLALPQNFGANPYQMYPQTPEYLALKREKIFLDKCDRFYKYGFGPNTNREARRNTKKETYVAHCLYLFDVF